MTFLYEDVSDLPFFYAYYTLHYRSKSDVSHKICIRTPKKLRIPARLKWPNNVNITVTYIVFTVIEQPLEKIIHEKVKSKFIVWMENNKLSHDSVRLKFLGCGAKKTYSWDSKAREWKP